MHDALVFDRDADGYQAGPPAYPRRVYELMVEIGALHPGARVLEVGPGTGQATEELLRRGARVDAVELGSSLADRLRRRLPSTALTVISGDICSVRLEPARYDLAVAATTFHWLDTAVVVPRLAAAMKPRGWLVVWWTVFGDPEADTPFRRRVDRLFEELLSGERKWPKQMPRALRTSERVHEVTHSGLFAHPRTEVIRWEHRMTASEARALFATFPEVSRLDARRQRRFLDELGRAVEAEGGYVDDPFVTAMYAVQRRPSSHRRARHGGAGRPGARRNPS